MRVALLARSGQARDQLHRALEEAGVLIVAEGDPAELDPKEVAEKLPKVFLVGLEPATEKSIDRFDALFEGRRRRSHVRRRRDHRQARRLGPQPLGAPPCRQADRQRAAAAGAGGRTRDRRRPRRQRGRRRDAAAGTAADASRADGWRQAGGLHLRKHRSCGLGSTSPSLTAGEGADTAGDEQAFHWDGSDAAAGSGDEGGGHEFKLDTDLGIDVDLGSLDFAASHEPEAAAPSTASLEEEAIFAELGEGMNFSSFGGDAVHEQAGDLDADVAALAAQLEAFEKATPVAPRSSRILRAPRRQKAMRASRRSSCRWTRRR
jgi:hypothetical protein